MRVHVDSSPGDSQDHPPLTPPPPGWFLPNGFCRGPRFIAGEAASAFVAFLYAADSPCFHVPAKRQGQGPRKPKRDHELDITQYPTMN